MPDKSPDVVKKIKRAAPVTVKAFNPSSSSLKNILIFFNTWLALSPPIV
jgi:hypothetical protein